MSSSEKILVIDDESDIRRIIADALEDEGFEVETAEDGESGLQVLAAGNVALAYVDINLPGIDGFGILQAVVEQKLPTDIIIITGKATVANAIEATKRGAYDYVTKPFDLDTVTAAAKRVMSGRKLTRRAAAEHQDTAPDSDGGIAARTKLVGRSPAMQEIYKIIGRIAASPATLLIQGESGTGKEIIAQTVHAYSERCDGPFVAVNCSAIPADLLESEMFGHERGAFTGATERHAGKFEQAGGGTLFLDEICDMPQALQAKLLRVLQEREFCRVGGRELLPADCRIIAATNKTMEKEVAAGRFREDLYFRLKVVVVELPPLRERREDIPLLVDFFVSRMKAEGGVEVEGVSKEAMALLLSHDWPGNVRELENILLRAAALTPNRILAASDIPLGPSGRSGVDTISAGMPMADLLALKVAEYLRGFGDSFPGDLYERTLSMVEKPLIETVLEHTGGNQLKAADILGINRNTLRKKITDHGISLPGPRSND